VHRPSQEWWDKSSVCSNGENKRPANQSHVVERDDTPKSERTDLARAAGLDKVSASIQGNGPPFARKVVRWGLQL